MITVTPVLSGSVAIFWGWASDWSYPSIWMISLVWAFLLPIDSPALVILITEVSPARHLGSALGFHSGLGFLMGSMTPIIMGQILDLTNPGVPHGALPAHWGWAFVAPGLAAYVGAFGLPASFGIPRKPSRREKYCLRG
jgi:hypothetical protein